MGPSSDHEASPTGQALDISKACAELRPRVVRIARALLRDAADADDATQMSLLEIVRSADSYRGEGSFAGWADRLAVRTILRIARERRVRSLRLHETEPDALPSGSHEPSMQDDLPRELREYLGELPETRRTALVLRHALGYSVDEVAELTGVSPNTVKDRLLAAREHVRKLVRRDLSTLSIVRGPR